MSLPCRVRVLGLMFLAGLLGLAEQAWPAGGHGRQLIQAVTENDLSTVRELLRQGVEVDFHDLRGRTALLHAVDGNRVEIARLLIDAGADVNAQDKIEDSPLLLAGASGRLEILKLILKANPDFNIFNRYGGTPLIPACERGHVEVVKLLLTTGVDIDHVNHLGWTALMEAIVLSDGGPRHQAIVRMLLMQHEADRRAGCWWTPEPMSASRTTMASLLLSTPAKKDSIESPPCSKEIDHGPSVKVFTLALRRRAKAGFFTPPWLRSE